MVRAISVGLILLALAANGVRQEAVAGTSLDAETMRAALRTTAIEENGFIDRVVAAANAGTLPAGIVDSSFQWARKKPKHKFQFFKQAVIRQAAEQGIEIK